MAILEKLRHRVPGITNPENVEVTSRVISSLKRLYYADFVAVI